MPEPLLLVAALLVAGLAVLWPLRAAPVDRPSADDEREAAELRHRAALEALRDVEADRRAGSLDDEAYAAELADAELRASTTRPPNEGPVEPESRTPSTTGRRAAAVAGAVIGLAIAAASMVPATGVANSTVTNEPLAEAQAREGVRQERIGELLAALADDGDDPETLSELADLYLAGTSREDLAVAATLLSGLIDLQPERADAYERIIGAYLRAGAYDDARAALDAYEQAATADPVEVAFFDGIIALRGEGDPTSATEAFDRFLELAPDDPRSTMIEALRDEAAAPDG